MPYLPPHLGLLGFSGKQIGVLLSFTPLLVCIAPPFWGYLADRTRRHLSLLRVAIAGAMVFFGTLYYSSSYSAVAVGLLGYSLFVSPITTLLDAATLAEIRRAGGAYGRVRLYGSAGFVVAALGLGALAQGRVDLRILVIGGVAGSLFLALISSLFMTIEGSVAPPPALADAFQLIKDRRLQVLLASAALHWFAMAPYHVFFSLHVQALDLSLIVPGAAMAVGAFAEMAVMWRFPGLSSARDPVRPLFWAYVASALRWGLSAVVSSAEALIAIQLLHAVSFGVFYLSAIAALARIVPEALRATGQALFVSTVFGAGGGIGTLIAGSIYDAFGGRALFVFVAAASAFAAVVVRALRIEEDRG